MQAPDTQCEDAVIVKVHSRRTKVDPKWESPYTVLLTSYFTVKVAERDNWIRHSPVKLPKEHQLDEPLSAQWDSVNPILEMETRTV